MDVLLSPLLRYRRPIVVLIHAVLVVLAYGLSFLLRFEFPLPPVEWERFRDSVAILLLVRLAVFWHYHLYEGLWRYVSVGDLLSIVKAVTLGSLFFLAGYLVLYGHGFPRGVLVADWVLCVALVAGVRLAVRGLREARRKQRRVGGPRTLIIGAGDGGELLIRELQRSATLDYDIVGLVDDDPRKRRTRIRGVEVVGAVDQLPELCAARHIQELLLAIPSATAEQRRRIIRQCRACGVPVKSVPPHDDLLRGRARIGQLQDVTPEDLLGRDPVQLDVGVLRAEISGKRVLVTGAGGSVGSELCRQLAVFEPALLVLFERSESSLYFVDLELRRAHPELRVVPVVGDILDGRQLEETIRAHAPDLVYHAAAYKHVPLMEEQPIEAIENNVFGTESVALAAQKGGVKRFVLISTDKAVRPVSIMGMTKRVAEGLLQTFPGDPPTFVAVRFGNVLGSDGSVLPLFQWQIATGGPVTVTDAQASRFFMLLSEAAQLVLRAGAMGKGGEVFFLDMGEPVRILDLAEDLIRLSGLAPGRDVPVELVGLRPGERLSEALVRDGEALLPTEDERVFVLKNAGLDVAAFQTDLERLRAAVQARDHRRAEAQLRAMAGCY